MPITPRLLQWLQSDDAASWLKQLTASPPTDAELLAVLAQLRIHFSLPQASALVTTARLREHAQHKFGAMATKMFFSEIGLQQASPWPVARYTAQRYASFSQVADLGCGLGTDSIALATTGLRVLAVDRSPLAVALTQANARALELDANIMPVQADITAPAWELAVAWADPGRRSEGRRIFNPDSLQPPLSYLLELQQKGVPHLGIKLMPGLSHQRIPPMAEAEWISLHGELKEVVLWFGDLVVSSGRRATVLPAGISLWARGEKARVHPPAEFFFEPDPAVIRAGAVSDLALQLGLWQVDPKIAYLSGDEAVSTPLARVWRIIEHHPFDLKWLNKRLRALQAQVVAVKKRGSPIEPETFRKRLFRQQNGREVILFITRVLNRPWMLITESPPFAMP